MNGIPGPPCLFPVCCWLQETEIPSSLTREASEPIQAVVGAFGAVPGTSSMKSGKSFSSGP